jgi:hypothetical protein
MQGGDPYMYQGGYDGDDYNSEFIYQEDLPEECDRIPTDQIYAPELNNGMPRVSNADNTININTGQPLSANADINMNQRSSSQAHNVPIIKMDEMLNPDFTPEPSR